MLCARLGHDTKHFNVGQYRRTQKGADDVQDAAFFDHNNEACCSSPRLILLLPFLLLCLTLFALLQVLKDC